MAGYDPARTTRDRSSLKDSPSLRREVSNIVADELASARSLVRANLQDYSERPRINIDSVTYTEAQVLGNWLPENE